MDRIHASVVSKSHLSPRSSLFIPNYSYPNRFTTNSLRNYRYHQTLPLKIPPLTIFPLTNFSVSAQFRRPSKRRNSLRKKLIEEQKGILHTHSSDKGLAFQHPVYNSDEIKDSDINQNLGDLDKSSGSRNTSTSGVEKPKLLPDSASWGKFESWVDQYKKDVEFWGIGSAPVFTVFRDMEGKVESVSVDEDEILRRSRIEPSFFKQEGQDGKFVEINSKITYAKRIAGEVENGVYEFPRNSSIAKFVVSGQETKMGFVNGIRSVVLSPDMLSKLPKIGFVMVCSFFVLWSVRKLFVVKDSEVELTREEKEMLRRKMKARMEREKMESGRVELLPKVVDSSRGSNVRPQLDKQELLNSISKLKTPGEEFMLPPSSSTLDVETIKFNNKVSEIKQMARQARELERKNREETQDLDKRISNGPMDTKLEKELNVHDIPVDSSATNKVSSVDNPLTVTATQTSDNSDSQVSDTVRDEGNGKSWQDPVTSETMDRKEVIQSFDSPTIEPLSADDLDETSVHSLENTGSQDEGSENAIKCYENGGESNILHSMEIKEVQPSSVPDEETYDSDRSSNSIKPKIILTVKEAKEYLSQKHNRGKIDKEPKINNPELGSDILESSTDEEVHVKASQVMRDEKEPYESSIADRISKTKSVVNDWQNSTKMKTNCDGDFVSSIPLKTDGSTSVDKNYEAGDFETTSTTEKYGEHDYNKKVTPVVSKESWMEKNFHELEPIIKKIGDGYTKNYAIAKEKAHEELNLRSEISLPEYGDSELEWMNDDNLREIVFRVRENELLGHDPFHMMDAEDKITFFKGLEKKAEKESEQLLKLHEYLHSRIENLDYGADGISVHDSPNKFIPRWKGPTVDKDPEFLNKTVNRPKDIFDENTDVPHLVNQNSHDTLQKSTDTTVSDNVQPSTGNYISKNGQRGRASKSPKTVIESSDGSVRAGKKSGKEFWQHTKKWSREFLELYNAETDPEVKSIMKDMGKDLDRWITEKEIQETGELMDNIPPKRRQYIEKKIGKLKREMEMFGPQAVVSKYREYGEAEEEDYLWWLDLPFVLCIELYTTEDGNQKVGFYSLEMAEDLELDPKQYHVIAFEDPGDCKSFCYIMQAHLEMLGTGSAFIVARPPKDAFREAKANGFSVTVIRKGEVQLNVDQTLEEVEEQIAEIGSKVYHDKMIRERGVDMGTLMKGVFGSNNPTKRFKSKRKSKKLPGTEP